MNAPSGLDDTTPAFIGRRLHFEPYYGYGWWDGAGRYTEMPSAFVARLLRLWFLGGVRRGGVAMIETPGHPCDGMWLTFETRDVGIYNFDTAPTRYTIAITLHDPPRDPGDDHPWYHEGPDVVLSGWGHLTAEQD